MDLRITKVDRRSRDKSDIAMIAHLTALVPGDRAAKMRRQRTERSDQRSDHLLCVVAVGKVEQHHEPGRPFDKGADRRLILSARD
jgi:hypothetical protein